MSITQALKKISIPVPHLQSAEPPLEPRISVLGVRRSGKSTFIGGWHIRLIDKALKGELKYRVHEYRSYGLEEDTRISGQRTAAAEMREGKFPLPTPQGLAFEADMSIRFPKRFGGEKTVHIPLIDVAGEDVAQSIEHISSGQWNIPAMNPIDRQLYNKIFRATGIILVMSAAGVTELEGQPENLFPIADVNLSHIVERVLDYKAKEAKEIPIKAMACILTKYDAVAERLLAQGMDLMSAQGRDKFMTKFLPETYSILGWYGLSKCLFLPTWVDLQYDGAGQVVWNPPDKQGRDRPTPMIQIDRRAGRPTFSISSSPTFCPSYDILTDWVKTNWGT